MTTAKQEAHKSVIDYLASLVWDGTPRLDRWLIDCAGAEDSPYVRRAARMLLISAVSRVRHHIREFNQMIVLEGPQGCGKSSALRVLAVEDAWFTAEFPLDAPGLLEPIASKWLLEAVASKWIVEVSELRRLGPSNVAALKACLSRDHDAYRRPYTREITQVPRRFVIIGTTNDADYLRVSTGNRRFWPVRVQRFNLEKLRADRDQLWAEAAEAEEFGGPLPNLYETAATEQEAGLAYDDPLIDVLHRALANRTGKLRVSDAYLICGIEPSKVNQEQILRFGQAIRELGWERQRRRFDGSLQYAYVKGTATEREIALVVKYDPHLRSVRIEVDKGAQSSGEP
jgi:hypothetical protein